MEIEKMDILFSPLEVGEVKDIAQLRKSYGSYKSTFHHLANNTYAAFLNSENEKKDLASLLSGAFAIPSTKKGEDWKVLIDRYIEFLGQFNKFLDSNGRIKTALKDRGLEFVNIEAWKDRAREIRSIGRPHNDEGIKLYLQLVADTKETVSCLWSVYQHFCVRDQMTTSFAYDGCLYLGVTWKDYLETIGRIAMGMEERPIYEMLDKIRKGHTHVKRNLRTTFTSRERDGAAFAEFPYKFDHRKSKYPVSITPCVFNKHVDHRLLDRCVIGDCKLELNDTDGMAVAMFDYKDKEDDMVHCLSFAGTRLRATSFREAKVMVQNVITDAYQFVCGASKVYYAALGILMAMIRTFPNEKIYVFGHSLGGGMMQFACASVNSPAIEGYGYNSAGLSWYNLRLVAKKVIGRGKRFRIEHICTQTDPVSIFGHQIGKMVHVKYRNILTAHCLANLNKKINNGHEVKVWF